MKATLEFDLPEEGVEFDAATKALEYKRILWDLNETFRSHFKHGANQHWDSKTVEEIRATLLNLLHDNNLSLD